VSCEGVSGVDVNSHVWQSLLSVGEFSWNCEPLSQMVPLQESETSDVA
jgi:hypothetical protein